MTPSGRAQRWREQCRCCKKWFTEKTRLARHLCHNSEGGEQPRVDDPPGPAQRTTHTGQIFPCDLCGEVYKLKSSLAKHRRLHVQRDTDFKSSDCKTKKESGSFKYRVKKTSEIFEKAFRKPYKSFKCKTKRESETSVSKSKNGSEYLECETKEECDYSESDIFSSDERYDSDDLWTGSDTPKCERVHIRQKILGSRVVLNNKLEKTHKCLKCKKTFCHKKQLLNHAVIHQGTASHQCLPCRKYFVSLKRLERHKQLHQECLQCGRIFGNQTSLAKHTELHHSDGSHLCSECSVSFSTVAELKHHLLSHSDPTVWICERCHKQFTQKKTLHIHIKNIHRDKLMACDLCEKSFKTKRSLDKHRVRHETVLEALGCDSPEEMEEIDDPRMILSTTDRKTMERSNSKTSAKEPPSKNTVEDEMSNNGDVIDEVDMTKVDTSKINTTSFRARDKMTSDTNLQTREGVVTIKCENVIDVCNIENKICERKLTHVDSKEEFIPIIHKSEKPRKIKVKKDMTHQKRLKETTSYDSKDINGESKGGEEKNKANEDITEKRTIDCKEEILEDSKESNGGAKRIKVNETITEKTCIESKEDIIKKVSNDSRTKFNKELTETKEIEEAIAEKRRTGSKEEVTTEVGNDSEEEIAKEMTQISKNKEGTNSLERKDRTKSTKRNGGRGGKDLTKSKKNGEGGGEDLTKSKKNGGGGKNITKIIKKEGSNKDHHCEQCDEVFLREIDMMRHTLTQHSQGTLWDTVRGGACLKYRCRECGRVCADKTDVTIHAFSHLGIKNFNCPECTKSFSRRLQLEYHMVVHTKEKKYQCLECQRSFHYLSYYYEHMMIHRNIKKHQCQECGARFVRKAYLDRHSVVHTRLKRHKCLVCEKTFRYRTSLREHMRQHTGQLLGCPHCSRQFASQANQTRHIRTHLTNKKLECEVCGKMCSHEGNLRSHLLQHTREKTQQVGKRKPKVSNKGERDANDKKKFQTKNQKGGKGLNKKKTSSKGISEGSLESEVSLSAETWRKEAAILDNTARIPSAAYLCARCQHTFTDVSEFSYHMSSMQCKPVERSVEAITDLSITYVESSQACTDPCIHHVESGQTCTNFIHPNDAPHKYESSDNHCTEAEHTIAATNDDNLVRTIECPVCYRQFDNDQNITHVLFHTGLPNYNKCDSVVKDNAEVDEVYWHSVKIGHNDLYQGGSYQVHQGDNIYTDVTIEIREELL